MTKILEMTGRSEAEAIEKALSQLQLERDEVSVEVVDRAKSGFLGFGHKPAKVRLSYEVPDEVVAKVEEPVTAEPPKTEQPVMAEPPKTEQVVTAQPPKTEQPVMPEPPKTEQPVMAEPPKTEQVVTAEPPKTEQVVTAEPPVTTVEGTEEQGGEEKTAKDSPVFSPPVVRNDSSPEEGKVVSGEKKKKSKKHNKDYGKSKGDYSLLEQQEIEAEAKKFLDGLMSHLHVEATPVVTFQGELISVKLEGENLASLIGRRGETLDAIQQITTYVVQKNCKKRVRLFLDAENYREKREETLIKLAEKMAGQCVKHRRNVPMEAMNSYERHIIHEALSDVPKVYTYSTGSDPNRRIVIAFAGGENGEGSGNRGKSGKGKSGKSRNQPKKSHYHKEAEESSSEKNEETMS